VSATWQQIKELQERIQAGNAEAHEVAEAREIEYREKLFAAWGIAFQIRALPLESMVADMDRTEAIAPMLDPTAWRAKGKQFSQDRRMVKALLDVKKVLKALAEEAAI